MTEIAINTSFAGTPAFLGDMRTYNGAGTATVRSDGLNGNGVSLTLQKEASRDTERGHANEVIGYLAIGEEFILSATYLLGVLCHLRQNLVQHKSSMTPPTGSIFGMIVKRIPFRLLTPKPTRILFRALIEEKNSIFTCGRQI